jgi:hypothetical protein
MYHHPHQQPNNLFILDALTELVTGIKYYRLHSEKIFGFLNCKLHP